MRIVHLVNHCNHGHGNAHVAIDLACEQARRGHEVYYASAGGDHETLLVEQSVHVVKITQNLRSPKVMLRAAWQIWQLCRTTKADLMHAHMMSGAVLGALERSLTRIPLVTTVHNSFDPHSVLMRAGTRIVAVSKAERDQLILRKFPEDRIDVVLNGPNETPRERAASTHEPVTQPRPCITTVCGLHRRKGIAELLAAFSAISDRFPEWSLLIVGDGPDRPELEGQSRSLGIDERVRFLGSLPAAAPILKSTDIFVLASHADPCSLAIAEAIYAGCAIVATAVGGTPELLDFGRRGILVEPRRPDELAKALARLISSEDERRRFGGAASRSASHFTIARVADEYEHVYARAMTNRCKIGDRELAR